MFVRDHRSCVRPSTGRDVAFFTLCDFLYFLIFSSKKKQLCEDALRTRALVVDVRRHRSQHPTSRSVSTPAGVDLAFARTRCCKESFRSDTDAANHERPGRWLPCNAHAVRRGSYRGARLNRCRFGCPCSVPQSCEPHVGDPQCSLPGGCARCRRLHPRLGWRGVARLGTRGDTHLRLQHADQRWFSRGKQQEHELCLDTDGRRRRRCNHNTTLPH